MNEIEKPDPSRVIDLGFDCKIISLGRYCFSRSFAERFHLYDFKKTRDVRMPFDGCTTSYNSLCTMLDTNFTNALDGFEYDGKKIVTSLANYPHEKTSEFDSFKEQMDKRITQFNKELQDAIETGSTIVFFLEHTHPPEKLVKIIKKVYQNLKFKIFCINYTFNIEERTKDDIFYKFVSIKTPWPNYTSHTQRESSIQAQNFEKKVLKHFLHFISEISERDYDVERIFSLRATGL